MNPALIDYYYRRGGGGVPTEVGEFLNDNFDRMSLGGDFTVTGPQTFTPNGTALVLGGTSSGFGPPNGLKYKFKHAFEHWIQSVTYTLTDAPTSGTSGLKIEHQDPITPDPNYTVSLNFKTSTGADFGTLRLYLASTLQGTVSSEVMSAPAINDVYRLTLEKVPQYDQVYVTFICTCEKLVGGVPVETITMTRNINWSSQGGEFAIGAFQSGGITVTNWSITVNDKKNAPYLVLGDSIGRGLTATTMGGRYINLLEPVNFATSTVPSDHTARGLERIESIIFQNPTNVILHIGTNDIVSLGYDRVTVVQPNYLSIRNQLVAAGINVIHLEMLPRSANANVALFNTWLTETFTTDTIIPLYDAFTTNSGTWYADAVHPNQLGHTAIKDAIIAGL